MPDPKKKKKKTTAKGAPKRAPRKRSAGASSAKRSAAKPSAGTKKARTFPDALAALLRSRGLKVPEGLLDAPPDAYAREPASFADELSDRPDGELRTLAARIASDAQRKALRARKAWDGSPVIAELRRRKLKEPPMPQRFVGIAFNLKRPVGDWSDAELLDAAREWSRRGRS